MNLLQDAAGSLIIVRKKISVKEFFIQKKQGPDSEVLLILTLTQL